MSAYTIKEQVFVRREFVGSAEDAEIWIKKQLKAGWALMQDYVLKGSKQTFVEMRKESRLIIISR